MRNFRRRFELAALVAPILVIWCAHQILAQRVASMTLMHLYSGPDGLVHAEKTEMKLRRSRLRAGLDESVPVKATGAQFLRWPPGYVWEWHTAAQPQYVITVSGHGEVEVAGGQKFPLYPGQVVLTEDVTGKGHVTRAIGSEDLVLLLVPLATKSE